MKNRIYILLFISFVTDAIAQKNFKWERIDSIPKNRNEIYSDTKLFIAETWKSAKDVIQNDDKEAGIILIKGISTQNINMGLGAIMQFVFSYNVKFFMKENKYKIVLENVNYERGPSTVWNKYDLKPKDVFPGLQEAGMKEKYWTKLMSDLKLELQTIVDDFSVKIKKPTSKSDW